MNQCLKSGTNVYNIDDCSIEAEDMTQLLGALDARLEEPCLIRSTYLVAHNHL